MTRSSRVSSFLLLDTTAISSSCPTSVSCRRAAALAGRRGHARVGALGLRRGQGDGARGRAGVGEAAQRECRGAAADRDQRYVAHRVGALAPALALPHSHTRLEAARAARMGRRAPRAREGGAAGLFSLTSSLRSSRWTRSRRPAWTGCSAPAPGAACAWSRRTSCTRSNRSQTDTVDPSQTDTVVVGGDGRLSQARD
jgi:hypothetical protein